MKKGWKVLRRRPDGLFSVLWINPVRYDFGVDTYPSPGDGPLAVFDRKEDAENFAELVKSWSPYLDIVVCPCLYAPAKANKIWGYILGMRTEQDYLPAGTALAAKVMLIQA